MYLWAIFDRRRCDHGPLRCIRNRPEEVPRQRADQWPEPGPGRADWPVWQVCTARFAVLLPDSRSSWTWPTVDRCAPECASPKVRTLNCVNRQLAAGWACRAASASVSYSHLRAHNGLGCDPVSGNPANRNRVAHLHQQLQSTSVLVASCALGGCWAATFLTSASGRHAVDRTQRNAHHKQPVHLLLTQLLALNRSIRSRSNRDNAHNKENVNYNIHVLTRVPAAVQSWGNSRLSTNSLVTKMFEIIQKNY